ncbi:MAG TPA: nuclear transport factor 2 family protein, partial [Actinomycetota bacterium]|nr:nuclear transport factor 2 family protein [Actinomycetota bacterium]
MAEHPNAARLREGYAAFASQDIEKLNEFFADDIVWHVPGRSPLAGDYKGKEEVFGFFMKLAGLAPNFSFDVHDCLANDDHAVALLTAHGERNGKILDEIADLELGDKQDAVLKGNAARL